MRGSTIQNNARQYNAKQNGQVTNTIPVSSVDKSFAPVRLSMHTVTRK